MKIASYFIEKNKYSKRCVSKYLEKNIKYRKSGVWN